jgi:hypothetical protein
LLTSLILPGFSVIVFLPSSVRVVSITNLAIFYLLCAVLHFKDPGVSPACAYIKWLLIVILSKGKIPDSPLAPRVTK